MSGKEADSNQGGLGLECVEMFDRGFATNGQESVALAAQRDQMDQQNKPKVIDLKLSDLSTDDAISLAVGKDSLATIWISSNPDNLAALPIIHYQSQRDSSAEPFVFAMPQGAYEIFENAREAIKMSNFVRFEGGSGYAWTASYELAKASESLQELIGRMYIAERFRLPIRADEYNSTPGSLAKYLRVSSIRYLYEQVLAHWYACMDIVNAQESSRARQPSTKSSGSDETNSFSRSDIPSANLPPDLGHNEASSSKD